MPGTFEWLDSFIEKNPQYTELSDRTGKQRSFQEMSFSEKGMPLVSRGATRERWLWLSEHFLASMAL